MFKREHKTSQMEDVNCALRSKVIFAGTPNLVIQPEMSALAQSAAEMEARRTASGQQEVLIVKRKVNLLELGSGLTRST